MIHPDLSDSARAETTRKGPPVAPAQIEIGAGHVPAIDNSVAVVGVDLGIGVAIVPVKLKSQPDLAADALRKEPPVVAQIADDRRLCRVVFTIRQALVMDQPGREKTVPLCSGQRDRTVQAVFLECAVVVVEIGFVRDRLDIEGQTKIPWQSKRALGEEQPAQFAGFQRVTAQRSVHRQIAGAEGLTIPQFERPGHGGQVGGQRQIGMIPDRDEVGQFDAESQKRRRLEFRDQKAAGPFERRIGQAHARDVEHRHTQNAQLGIVEIDLSFFGIVNDTARADRPERRPRVAADLAGGRGDLAHCRVPPADTHRARRGQLQLLVQNEARAFQQAVLKPLIEFRLRCRKDIAVGLYDPDRSLNVERILRPVVHDA